MTGVCARVLARHRKARADGEGGFTMLEMVVGMTLMTIFLGIFTGSIVSMFDSTNKSQSVNNTSAQLNMAFDHLDKTIRYASYIGEPAVAVDGNWYVVFQTTNTGTPVCTQLRIDQTKQQLQRRTWNVTGTAPDTEATDLTAWQPLASGITNGGAAAGPDQPFTFTAAGSALTYEQLGFRLLAKDGSGKTETSSLSSVTFTAINTSLQTPKPGDPSIDVCEEVTGT